MKIILEPEPDLLVGDVDKRELQMPDTGMPQRGTPVVDFMYWCSCNYCTNRKF
jgi:hypothetical protein